MVQHAVTWEIEQGRLELADEGESTTFWSAAIRVDLEPRYCAGRRLPQDTEITGTIRLTHDVPQEVFFKEDGCPRKLDLIATSGDITIEVDGLLANGEPCYNEIQFVAFSADYTDHAEPEPEPEPEPEEQTVEERTTALLGGLIEDIANGDVDVNRISASRDPKPVYNGGFPAGWADSGPTTLEIVYND